MSPSSTGDGGADGGDPAGGDRGGSGGDAVERIQRGLLVLIGAARAGLDAVETVVADRERLDALADRGREVLASLAPDRPGRDDDHPGP